MRPVIFIALALLTASCQQVRSLVAGPDLPSVRYRYQEQLAAETFDSAGSWREYDRGPELRMKVAEGAYQMELGARQYVWTQTPDQYADVVMSAAVRPRSDVDSAFFGIACRLDPANSGRGYYFLISGDGYVTIRWSNGRSLEDIVSARITDAIQRGRAHNRLKAVCIEDYLGFWVNDRFVAEARDKRAGGGSLGLAAALNAPGHTLSLSFDDLSVWRAALE